MRTLKKSEKDLIVKVNEFRDFAKEMSTYGKATDVMRELTWLLSVEDREALQEAWRTAYVDVTGKELDAVCNKIIEKIQTGKN
jgi:hypothetical protein